MSNFQVPFASGRPSRAQQEVDAIADFRAKLRRQARELDGTPHFANCMTMLVASLISDVTAEDLRRASSAGFAWKELDREVTPEMLESFRTALPQLAPTFSRTVDVSGYISSKTWRGLIKALSPS